PAAFKVDETTVNAAGWYFARITQSAQYTYEGLGGSVSKVTTKLFEHDTTMGTLTKESNLGEVGTYNASSHSYGPVLGPDVYNQYHYVSVAGAVRPDWIKTTSDSVGSIVLRETDFSYDASGNLTNTIRSGIATNSFTYDNYGNPLTATDPVPIITS